MDDISTNTAYDRSRYAKRYASAAILSGRQPVVIDARDDSEPGYRRLFEGAGLDPLADDTDRPQ